MAAHDLKLGAIVAALAVGFALVPRAMTSCRSATGEEAPDFTAALVANAPSPGDETLTLSALRGRPVLLDFWATWCQPCRAEAPIVNAVAKRYKDRGLVVIGVNTSDGEGSAALHVRHLGLTFPIVYDANNTIARDFRVANLPTLVVVSKEGKIVAVRHGVTAESDLDDIVRRIL